MTQARDPGQLYRAAKPHLDAALESYLTEVRAVVDATVSDALVHGRVKSARSLIRKLRKDPSNPRTWESISDKVGIRVICATRADCKAVDGALRSRWPDSDREVKKGAVDRLYYPGIHLSVTEEGFHDHEGSSLPCEIQIRTRAQDAWSVVSHKLLYKGVIEPPARMQRMIHRLTVVVEMFDDDVHRLFRKRRRLPMYEAALTLEALEGEYEAVTGEPVDGSPDLSIVSTLLQAYESPSEARKAVADYCLSERDDVADLLLRHLPEADTYVDSRDWLFTQPEVLLVLERSNAKPFLLAHAIENTDLEDVVRKVCISAERPLPAA